MFRRNALMIVADGDSLRRLQKALGAISEFFDVHLGRPFVLRRYGVLFRQHKLSRWQARAFMLEALAIRKTSQKVICECVIFLS
jgi:hypothetical protein